MAMQAGTSVAPCSPHVVGNAFVQQYYSVLYRSPEHVHKFYHDESFIGRPDYDGNMTCVTTTPAINEQILSTDFTNCLIKLENVDTQSSHKNGVLILVTGSFICADTVKQRFTQSFFLAPQENGGYFVLNDVLRYIPERPSTDINEAFDKHVNEGTEFATIPTEPEKMSVKERVDPELPSAENVSVKDEVVNSSAIDNSEHGSNVDGETCVKVVTEEAMNIPEAAPAPPVSALKDVTKQSYASIVKMMEGTPSAPVVKPKPKPKPMLKGAENGEKSTSLPAKPAQTSGPTPPERGYSVFVANLPINATIQMVDEEFSKFGAIKPGCVQVKNHPHDGFCFGFVEFESQKSMRAAIEASPIHIGSNLSHVEEKRTPTRVVNGVITHGDNNGNIRGNRFQQGRGGYSDNYLRGQASGYVNNGNYRDVGNFRGDGFRGQGMGSMNNGNYRDGDNFRGRGAGSMNNGNYRDGDNMRNEFRNRNEYSGRNCGPQGNGYHPNGNGYHQDGNGYRQNENGYQQNKNGYRQNEGGYRQDEGGYRQRQNEGGYRQGEGVYRQNENNYYQNGNGYHEPRRFHGGNGRPPRPNGPRQATVAG